MLFLETHGGKKPNTEPTDLLVRNVVLHFMKYYIVTLTFNVYM